MKISIHYLLYPLFLVLLLVQTWRIQHMKASEVAAKKVFVHAISWAPACVFGTAEEEEQAAQSRYADCRAPDEIKKARIEYDQLSNQ